MDKRVRVKIFSVIFIVLIVILSLVFILADVFESEVINNKVQVIRTPDYTVYNDSGKSTLNIGERNFLNRTSGKYEPWDYNLDTSFTSNDTSMIIEWKGKKVILNYYEKTKEIGEEAPIITEISKDSVNTEITKQFDSYYFTHKLKDEELPTTFGYSIITINTFCYVEGESLICDEQTLDLSMASSQGLNVTINKDYIEYSKTDKTNLSFIDPTLNITGATTMCGVNDTYDTINIYSTLTVCAYNGTASTGFIHLQADTINVMTSGIITANGKGYRGVVADPGEGPGGGGQGYSCGGYFGGGGAYGGNGGSSCGSKFAGVKYANSTNVTQMGSAGGGDGTDAGSAGSNGGGLIILDATNLTNNGIIRANGDTGAAGKNVGGGAGGGIWITALNISGTGNFTANGGSAGSDSLGGRGGGGRILLQYYNNDSAAFASITVLRGSYGYIADGENGTFVWLYDTSFDNPLDATGTVPASPSYTNDFYVYANATKKINDIVSINFTITTPNGTIISQGVNGTYDGTSWKSASFTIGDRDRESDLGIWTWSVQGYTSLGLVGSLSGSFIINYWNNNTNIVTGLVDVGTMSMPNTFINNGVPILISGANDGLFDGYQWNGTQWIVNNSYISGLVDVGTISSLTTYYKDGKWQMIVGAADGLFDGYTWNGTGWSVNATQIAGLVDVGSNSVPTVFNISGTYNLIVGENTAGAWNGRTWNGTGWQANTTVVSGLDNLGINTIPYTFNMFGKTYLISGANNGNYYGYTWNGSGWTTNNNIITGLYNVVNRSAPTVLDIGTATYLISGRTDGTFVGFNLTDEYTPGEPPDDSCTYTSGNWVILFSDYCNITSPVDVGGNSITITGAGEFRTTANITGWKTLNLSGTEANSYNAYCLNGGCFV